MSPAADQDRVSPDAVQVSPDVTAAVLREGRSAAPEEACGLLLGRREKRVVRVTRSVPCENTAPEESRTERFAIDPRRVIEMERSLRDSGEVVVGFYHSHPVSEAVPSKVDRPFMKLWPGMLWLIVGNAEDPARASLRVWEWPADRPGPPGEIPIEIPA